MWDISSFWHVRSQKEFFSTRGLDWFREQKQYVKRAKFFGSCTVDNLYYWVDVGYFVLACREKKVKGFQYTQFSSMSREMNILEVAQSKTRTTPFWRVGS